MTFIHHQGIVSAGAGAATVTPLDLYAGDLDAACAILFALVIHYDVMHRHRKRGAETMLLADVPASDLLLRWVRSLSPQPPLSRVRCNWWVVFFFACTLILYFHAQKRSGIFLGSGEMASYCTV